MFRFTDQKRMANLPRYPLHETGEIPALRLAAAKRSLAGRRELALVLEQARSNLAAVRNEFAADALCIASARVLAAAPWLSNLRVLVLDDLEL